MTMRRPHPSLQDIVSLFARYGLAVGSTGISALFRLMVPDALSPAPYLGFYPAVVVSAALGGVGPGLVATFASLLLVNFVFGTFDIHNHGAMARQLIWVVASIGVSLLAGMQRASRVRHRQQREWLAVTLSSIGDAVIATDTGGEITFLNPVAEALTGWKEQEVLGRPVQDVFRIINEQTRQQSDDIVARVLREGVTVALANHTAIQTRDGREIPIEDSAAPIKGADGKMTGVVVVFHDVAQKRRAQEALAQSEQRYRSFVEASSQVVWTTNARGEVNLDIPAWQAYTGQTAEEASGFGWMDAIHPDDRSLVATAWAKAFESRGIYEVEYRLRVQDGTWRHILARGVPQLTAAGEVRQYVGTCIDITDRKRAEEALRESEDKFKYVFDHSVIGK